ncbi:MAG: hypothetical protein HQM12_16600 [SAR324 cluster bacterium]|nr:hypothetical protein [SAR324 cluster bacterium]
MRLWIVIGVVMMIAVATVLNYYRPETASSPTKVNIDRVEKRKETHQSPPPITYPATIDQEKLIGRWFRIDGRYVLEIKKVHPKGQLDAAYYNPRSIHIAESRIFQESSREKLFIKFQDEGYQGSSYTLDYEPQRNLLIGTYYHATLKQKFEVVFALKK